jgi:hypothetical protein
MKFKFEEGEKVYCTENEVLYKSKASPIPHSAA